MRLLTVIICLSLIIFLVALNHLFVSEEMATYGGLSWGGWIGIVAVAFAIGLIALVRESTRAFGFFRGRDLAAADQPAIRVLDPAELNELKLIKYRGPEYPHPVIFPDRCIGCQACVDACPHDVLAIGDDGWAVAVTPDLCMEDTACQAECPVNPKACIVINTTKEVRSRPTPMRNGNSYETNVEGCFIVGDVSGVPLIKNAVKEGYEVIDRIAEELRGKSNEPRADLDVAIIGIGPGGASAAAAAQDLKLRYVAIEQDKTLSTIHMYPKGKYIFFKPDTKDWFGGITVAGLGISNSKYGEKNQDQTKSIIASLGGDVEQTILKQTSQIEVELIEKIPTSVRREVSTQLNEAIRDQIELRIARFLQTRSSGNWPEVYQHHFVPQRNGLLTQFHSEIIDQFQTKVPGDQRENILAVWLGTLNDKGVRINEFESCKSVKRADDGDYFTIETEFGNDKQPRRYAARRVVLSIGLRGAPNKLRLPNEDIKITIDGRHQPKVLYALTNPDDYRGRHLVVVGGGNAAVEAAIDLAGERSGGSVVARPPEARNRVTMLVRDYLAPTVKFGNKYLMYHCADERLLDLRFGVGIKEMRDRELVIEDVRTNQIVDTIPNDFVFALIGGERPDRFLKSVGIKIV
jgi:thioredoxin reductase